MREGGREGGREGRGRPIHGSLYSLFVGGKIEVLTGTCEKEYQAPTEGGREGERGEGREEGRRGGVAP